MNTYKLLILLAWFSLSAFAHNGQSESEISDRITNSIHMLPEVKAFILKTKKQHPCLLLARKPDKDFNYYWIQVGLNNYDRFRPHYNFYVTPKTLEIFFIDNMIDDGEKSNAVLTLKEWRYWRNKPGFNKMHTYRNGQLIISKTK